MFLQVRIGTRSGLALPDAIDQAVAHCIEHHVLESFLRHHRAEVTNMILKEFNLEEHIKSEKAYSLEEGLIEGENKSFLLMQKLLTDGRNGDLTRASTDLDFRKSLYKEYHIL